MDESAQGEWLDTIYDDDRSAFLDCFNTELLKNWLARTAREDMGTGFRPILLDADEVDSWIEEAQWEDGKQHREWGITRAGDGFYYGGGLSVCFTTSMTLRLLSGQSVSIPSAQWM